jgi:hypothetical protein
VHWNQRTSLPFEEAWALARSLQLATRAEWWTWCKEGLPGRPLRRDSMPTHPQIKYRENWTSWGVWLGRHGSRCNFTS